MSRVTWIAATLLTLAVAVRSLTLAVRRSAEAGLIRAISTIEIAQIDYYASFRHYASSLRELATLASGAGGLIGPELASGKKGIYEFTLTLTPTGYTITATSVGPAFLPDQTIKINVEPGAAHDPVLDPPVIRSPGAPAPQPSRVSGSGGLSKLS